MNDAVSQSPNLADQIALLEAALLESNEALEKATSTIHEVAADLIVARADKAKLETALAESDQGRQSAIALRDSFSRQLDTLHIHTAEFAERMVDAEGRVERLETERNALSLAKMELAARVETLLAERNSAQAAQLRLESLARRARQAAADRAALSEREQRHLRIISSLSARLGLLEATTHDLNDDAIHDDAEHEFDADLRHGGSA